VNVTCLVGSRIRDGTNALLDLRPPGRLDGAADTLRGIEGRRAAGTAPGGSGAAAADWADRAVIAALARLLPGPLAVDLPAPMVTPDRRADVFQ
jgi:hypothetical protein